MSSPYNSRPRDPRHSSHPSVGANMAEQVNRRRSASSMPHRPHTTTGVPAHRDYVSSSDTDDREETHLRPSASSRPSRRDRSRSRTPVRHRPSSSSDGGIRERRDFRPQAPSGLPSRARTPNNPGHASPASGINIDLFVNGQRLTPIQPISSRDSDRLHIDLGPRAEARKRSMSQKAQEVHRKAKEALEDKMSALEEEVEDLDVRGDKFIAVIGAAIKLGRYQGYEDGKRRGGDSVNQPSSGRRSSQPRDGHFGRGEFDRARRSRTPSPRQVRMNISRLETHC